MPSALTHLPTGQNDRHFADNIFSWTHISLYWIRETLRRPQRDRERDRQLVLRINKKIHWRLIGTRCCHQNLLALPQLVCYYVQRHILTENMFVHFRLTYCSLVKLLSVAKWFGSKYQGFLTENVCVKTYMKSSPCEKTNPPIAMKLTVADVTHIWNIMDPMAEI